MLQSKHESGPVVLNQYQTLIESHEFLSWCDELEGKALADDSELARSISHKVRTWVSFDSIGFGLSPAAKAEVIGTIIHEPETILEMSRMAQDGSRLYSVRFPLKAKEWFVQFLKEWLHEFRKHLCGTTKRPQKFGNAIKSAIVSIAATISQALGITSAVALGLVTLVVMTLMQVTKNSFCKVTDSKLLEDIAR